MADQSALHIFQAVSTAALWGIVIWLVCIHIAEYIKKRTRLKALILDGQGKIRDEHASFVRYGSYWYIRAVSEQGMVGLRQKSGDTVYKLRSNIPYRIQQGDIVYISYEKIVIQ